MSKLRPLTTLCLVLASAATAGAQDRQMSLGLGLAFGAFNGCPSFGLAASFPVHSRLSAEAEFAYFFNPAEAEKNPPPGYHRSSAALALTVSGTMALGKPEGRLTPFLAAGAGYVYLSVLTDRPPDGREVSARNRLAAALAAGLRMSFSPRAGLKVEARWLFLSGGEGRVVRVSTGAFVKF